MTPKSARSATIRRFRQWGLLSNPDLPLIENTKSVRPKTANQIASRAASISYVVGVFYKADRRKLVTYLQEYGLWNVVPKSEQEMLTKRRVSEEERLLSGWLPESAQILIWSLRLTGLDHLSACDEKLASFIPYKVDPVPFIERARLRSRDQLIQEADTLYMLHWAANDAVFNGRSPPVHPLSAQYRRHAIDWVLGVAEEWDAVSLDT